MFTRVHHAGYLVEDLDKTIAWYERALGGKAIGRGAGATRRRNAFVQTGDTMVELVEDKVATAGKGGQVLDHVGYQVDDIEKAIVTLKATGMKFATNKPITNMMGWKLIYFDPASTMGTRIHLTQM